INFLLEIGLHLFLSDQFVVLFRSKDDRVVDAEIPNTLGVDIFVGLGVVGIYGNDAVGALQNEATKLNTRWHGILSLFVGLLSENGGHGQETNHKEEVLKACWFKYWFCPFFQTSYKFFSARLIMFSTLSEVSSANTFSTTFSDCLLA